MIMKMMMNINNYLFFHKNIVCKALYMTYFSAHFWESFFKSLSVQHWNGVLFYVARALLDVAPAPLLDHNMVPVFRYFNVFKASNIRSGISPECHSSYDAQNK